MLADVHNSGDTGVVGSSSSASKYTDDAEKLQWGGGAVQRQRDEPTAVCKKTSCRRSFMGREAELYADKRPLLANRI